MSTTDAALTANLTEATDPAHIHPRVEELLGEFQRRFRDLRGLVRRTVGYEHDALHLSAGRPLGVHGTGQFDDTPEPVDDFPTAESAAKAAFAAWFLNAARQTILDPLPEGEVRAGAHWLAPFLDDAFVQGIQQARGQLMQAGVEVGSRPDPQDILTDGGFRRALATRYWSAFSELEGITDDMAAEMDRTLAEAFDEGWSPRKTADTMTARIGRFAPEAGLDDPDAPDATRFAARAKALSRTELSFAQAQASLRRYQRAGVGTVGHVGRIVTPDSRLCAFCRALADETFTLREFAGTRALFRGTRYFIGVPAHVNCRCAPIPRPGVQRGELAPLSERVPGTVIGEGLDMFGDPVLAG